MTKSKHTFKKYLKLFGKIILVLLVLFFILVLVIRTPWAQNLIVTKITNYISDKTNTKVAVGTLYITFSGDIQVENVYMEDKKGDTLFHARSLQADIPIYPLLFKNQLTIDAVDSEGVTANISRGDTAAEFNFSFLIDALTTPTDSSSTTTTEPMGISLGEFDFSDWKLNYDDEYLGMDMKLVLGKLLVDISDFDLEKMKFGINTIVLNDSEFTYLQSHPFPETTDTAATTLPYLKVDDFELTNLQVKYSSKPDDLETDLTLGTIKLSDILANVPKNQYETNDLVVHNSQITLHLTEENKTSSGASSNNNFAWPEFILAAQNVDLVKNSFSYSLNRTQQNSTVFDPNAFQIQQLQLQAYAFEYRPKKFNLMVSEFSFSEPSGMRLDQLAFKAELTDTFASLTDLAFQLNQSSANANLKVQFESLEKAVKSPQRSSLTAAISNLILEMEDVQQFVPQLRKNSYIDSLAMHTITGSLNAKGSLKKVEDFTTDLNWGPKTKLTASGSISQLTQPDSLRYDLNTIAFNTVQKDIKRFISSKELGISIPKTLTINGKLSGTTTRVSTDSRIQIPEGLAKVDVSLNFGNSIGFKGVLEADTLQLGKLLDNDKLGTISFKIKGSGSGTESANMNATVQGSVSQFQFNGHSYRDIEISGDLKDGTGSIASRINDPNLNMTANCSILLETDQNKITLTSNIIGADLQQLGFTKNNIKIAADINGTYLGTPSNYTIETTIDQGIAVADNEQYQVSTIQLSAHIEDSITDVSIKSDFINGQLSSNASPNRITKALKKQLEHYFSTDPRAFEVEEAIEAKLALAIEPTPILSKVFFNGIKNLDSLNIDASFNSKFQQLTAEVKIPQISYAGSSVDSLYAYIKGDSVDLKFSAGIADLVYGPIHLKQTNLEGSLKNKKLVLDFNSKNDTVQVMHISSELVFQKDTLSVHIDPKDLVLNKKQWQLPDDNSIIIADSFTDFQNLIVSRNAQKLEISNKVPKMETDHIGILFENFQLQSFLSLFNPDEALAKGKVEGNFVILNPYEASGLLADIEINDFQVMQNPLGTLKLDASSKSFSVYDFDLALKNGGADLSLTGDYTIRENTSDLNLELDIRKLETSVIQGFFKEQLSNPKGSLSGSMVVGGTLAEPSYSGRINFNEMGLSLAAYNTTLEIDDQTLDLDQDKISFNSFKINDLNQGTFTLNGTILTQNLFNPGFDLSVKTDKFRILDSKKGDDELVYGIASVKADLKISGDLELPVIDGTVRIRDITDLTYVVPQDQLDVQERDGVVIFVNRENPDAILTRNDRETSNSFFAGMDVNTTLEIANEATFTIVLDEKTQDKLQASGNATLNLNIDPNQDIRLSGRLELNSGFYRTSLYNLVSREFQLQKGSSIVWSGDPYDAKMDVTAIYEIETSAAPLMSAISFGQDSGVAGRYQQAAPFLVYLNIDGQIMEPELSFALDMPENAQGNFGGAVYGRIQQLNEQESELNKQVFSLLALNRFYPSTGSDGSNGGAIALARNNVNKVLSSELNAISNKLLGNSGFELGFDLDSFQDYESGTAQNRTQLNINASKKLFDDRLIVTAGSAVDVEGSAASSDTAAPLIGNVTLEYLLSEEGTYRLKGFRRQEYQNIIDGQLIVTGVAFIFDREFNKFSQLFSPLAKVETEANPSKEKKKDKKSDN